MFLKFISKITKNLQIKFFSSRKTEKYKEFSIDEVNEISKDFGVFDKLMTFYIKKNIDSLLNDILSKFNSMDFLPKIGIEIEFALKKCIDINDFFYQVKSFCNANNIDIIEIEKERGEGQFEIKFSPYLNIDKLINDYNTLKLYLLENFDVSFDLIYKYGQPFNALQTNISLWDGENNVFAKNSDGEESLILIYAVNGLLKHANKFLNFYVANDFEFIRYSLDINKNLQNIGFVPAPTFLSWGINNRTATIRIPVPKDLTDLKNYHNVDKIERRVECRLASANADIKFVLYCNLISMYDGIFNKDNYLKKNSYNIIESHEYLQEIKKEKISSYLNWIF